MDLALNDIEAAVRNSMRTEMGEMFADLRRFVDRRIAELSTEIHATVQLVDFSEANLSGQLARIHDQIGSLVAAPSMAAHNSGLELEAVVQVTEDAANRIMEAAEAIASWVHDGKANPAGLSSVANEISAIFEACSFQDLTSQRIRRAIEHLQQVETMLDNMIPDGTTAAALTPVAARKGMVEVNTDNTANPDMAQAAIDRLLDF